jgi:hypothetical protein
LSVQTAEIEQLVRSKFSVKEYFALPDGELEFRVVFDGTAKQKFAKLQSEASAKGFRPELTGTKDECILTIRKAEPPASNVSRVPVVLALLTAVSLVVFGLLQQDLDRQLVPSMSAVFIFFGFSGTIAVLMAAHELGQLLAARTGQAGHSNSYLIPGIPFLTPFLPSLGFVNAQRQPALNKDRLFDVVIAGPLAILLFSVIFYVIGILTSVPSTVPFQSTQLVNSTVSINPNAIELAINTVMGPLVKSVPAGFVQVSPIADGAAFGFVLVFICLLPMAIFDGGLLSNLAWGERAARAATYLSVLLLLVIDMNYATYWATAIVALLLAGRPVRLKILDEVSGLSAGRRWAFVGSLIFAFLCLPIPHTLVTIPLT